MAGIQPGTYRPDEGFPDSAYFGPGQTYNDAPNRMPGAPPGFIMNPYLPAAPKKPTIQPYLNPTPVPPNVGRGAYIPDDREKIDESSDESNRRTPQYDGGVSEGYGTVGRDLAQPGALLELLKAIPQVLSQATPSGMVNIFSQLLTNRTIPANIRGLLSMFPNGIPSVPTTTSSTESSGYMNPDYSQPDYIQSIINSAEASDLRKFSDYYANLAYQDQNGPGAPNIYPTPNIPDYVSRPEVTVSPLEAVLSALNGLTTDNNQTNDERIKAYQDGKYAPEVIDYDAVYQDYLMDEQQKAYDDALSAAGGY